MNIQCKCGSKKFFMKKNGNNTGLYCIKCGKWKKWMNKDEIRIFEHNHKFKKENAIKQTNADRIRAMSDEELAEFLSDNTNCDCCNIQCPDKLNCPSMSSCYCRYLQWLKQEVEDETT